MKILRSKCLSLSPLQAQIFFCGFWPNQWERKILEDNRTIILKQNKRTQNGQFSPLKECKTAAHYSSVRGWDVAVGERVRQRPGLRGARRQRQPGQALQPVTRVSLGRGGHCFQSKKQKALCCPQSGAGTLHWAQLWRSHEWAEQRSSVGSFWLKSMSTVLKVTGHTN